MRPARGLNLSDHTNQEAHDAPWFGARGSNTGPGLAIPGGAPLCHSCYDSKLRKMSVCMDLLTPKLLKNTDAHSVVIVVFELAALLLLSLDGNNSLRGGNRAVN